MKEWLGAFVFVGSFIAAVVLGVSSIECFGGTASGTWRPILGTLLGLVAMCLVAAICVQLN